MKSDSGTLRSRANGISLLVALLVLMVLSTLLFLNGMSKPPARDEQMYCTAGVLMAQGKTIYRDFAYVAQLPYHPLILAALYRLLDTNHYLLTGRVLSILCECAIMVAIVAVFRFAFRGHRAAGTLFGAMGALFYACNPVVYMANGYAWNHDVVLLSVMLALWIILTIDKETPRRLSRFAMAGGLLTLASCMRITTGLAWALLLFYLLFGMDLQRQARLRSAMAFLLGTLLVLCWPLVVIARAPEVAFLNVVSLPRLYAQWHYDQGSAHNKIDLTLICLTTLGYLSLLVAMACTTVSWVRQRHNFARANRRRQQLLLGMTLTFVIIAFVPPTMWQQYWAMPVPFMILALAFPLDGLWRRKEHSLGARIALGLLFGCLAVTLTGHLATLRQSPPLLSSNDWGPNRLHRLAQTIGQVVKDPNPILTMSPLYALEGGRGIYSQLSTGAILFRIADRLSEEDLQKTKTVGPNSLDRMLKQRPPGAILLGTESGMLKEVDAPFSRHILPKWHVLPMDQQIRLYYDPNGQ